MSDDAIAKLAAVSKSKRDRAEKKGQALKQPGDKPASFPIENETDLKNAIQAFGRARDEDKPRLKRFIMSRAFKLKRPDLIPDSWKKSSKVSASALDKVNEDQGGDALIRLASRASLDRSPRANWV